MWILFLLIAPLGNSFATLEPVPYRLDFESEEACLEALDSLEPSRFRIEGYCLRR